MALTATLSSFVAMSNATTYSALEAELKSAGIIITPEEVLELKEQFNVPVNDNTSNVQHTVAHSECKPIKGFEQNKAGDTIIYKVISSNTSEKGKALVLTIKSAVTGDTTSRSFNFKTSNGKDTFGIKELQSLREGDTFSIKVEKHVANKTTYEVNNTMYFHSKDTEVFQGIQRVNPADFESQFNELREYRNSLRNLELKKQESAASLNGKLEALSSTSQDVLTRLMKLGVKIEL